MLLIYTPEDGERQEFIFRPSKMPSVEAEAIEEVGGTAWDTWEEFGGKFIRGSAKARRAALWIMLRRQNPKLKFADVSVLQDQLEVDYEDDEVERMRVAIAEDEDLSEEDKARLLAPLEPGKSPAGDESTDST